MFPAVIIVALALIGLFAGVLLLVALSVHTEEWRGSTTHHASGLLTRGTRRFLGLYVDHTACVYASNPDHACPSCKRNYRPSRLG